MLPGLQVGDQLIVTKYAYGWSFVSPTIPNPIAMFRSLVLHQEVESWGVQLPFIHGRLFGKMPERGDVVIVTPTRNTDYIKRLIGLPGDRLQVIEGTVFINGVAVKRGPPHEHADPGRPEDGLRPGATSRRARDRAGRQILLPADPDHRDAAQWPALRHGRDRPERRRQLRPDHDPPGSCVPDGRQSRP